MRSRLKKKFQNDDLLKKLKSNKKTLKKHESIDPD